MNLKDVNEQYKNISSASSGTTLVKFDLHIHTPSSKDFVSSKSLNAKEKYIAILDAALDNSLRIIAITDHNTFEGFNITKDLLENDKTKYHSLFVLCGIEITCFSKHLLAIFPPDLSIEKQNLFLDEIGIPTELRGTQAAMADIHGPSILIDEIINKYGGFSILAHADSDAGFLHSWCKAHGEKDDEISFTGKSLAKIIKSKHLLGIQVNNQKNRRKIADKLKNIDFQRKYTPLPLLCFSDSHGHVENDVYLGTSGQKIGDCFSFAKLSTISFNSIKLALSDPEIRILDTETIISYPWIIGCAIKSNILVDPNNDYCMFKFNPEMNCIIGARGTGKSTLLKIIQSILMPNSIKDELSDIYLRYSSAIIYFSYGDFEYAISCDTNGQEDEYTGDIEFTKNLKNIYIKDSCSFRKTTKQDDINFLKIFLSSGYKQGQIHEIRKNPYLILNIVDDFLKWKKPDAYINLISQIEYNKTELKNIFNNIEKNRKDESIVEYIDRNDLLDIVVKKHRLISNLIYDLFKIRNNMVDELNELLKGKVQIQLSWKIAREDYNEIINILPELVARATRLYYPYQVKIRDHILKRICDLSPYANSFDFFILLLENNFDDIIRNYNINCTCQDLENIKNSITADCFLAFMENDIQMKYNINSGINSKEKFLDNSNLSLGQKAVAQLLLVLNAAHNLGDNRPLLMDQPEDDLDNSYIYSTLVDEFRKSKRQRQIIISTHNPNMPVAADSENILVLKYDGEHGYLANNGSIDNPETIIQILDILEGGRDAIQKRLNKYQINL